MAQRSAEAAKVAVGERGGLDESSQNVRLKQIEALHRFNHTIKELMREEKKKA